MSPPTPQRVHARCLVCGHEFHPTHGVEIGIVTGASVGSRRVVCPRCGGDADVLADQGIERRAEPQWSWQLAEQLSLNVRLAIEEKPDDLIAPVETISPEIGYRIRRITQNWTQQQTLDLLAAIVRTLASIGHTTDAPAPAVEALRAEVEELLARAEEIGTPPPTPLVPPENG
jgi:hypothetical protein